jgi:hypothetical protein
MKSAAPSVSRRDTDRPLKNTISTSTGLLAQIPPPCDFMKDCNLRSPVLRTGSKEGVSPKRTKAFGQVRGVTALESCQLVVCVTQLANKMPLFCIL